MVAVRVRGEVEDALGHLGADGQDLAMKRGGLRAEHLHERLNAARPVQVHRDIDKGGDDGLDKLAERVDRANLNELLAQVVAELVHHDLWQHLLHDVDEAGGEDAALVGLIVLQLALNHATPRLVVGHHLNVLNDLELLWGQLRFQVFWKLQESRHSLLLVHLLAIAVHVILRVVVLGGCIMATTVLVYPAAILYT